MKNTDSSYQLNSVKDVSIGRESSVGCQTVEKEERTLTTRMKNQAKDSLVGEC